jgi:hypothetical protein
MKCQLYKVKGFLSRKRVGLHEVIYERLSEAEKRRPHAPSEMRSGNSKGPVKMWICHEKWCGEVQYTYGGNLAPPSCDGGARWSFSTNGIYDPRIHKEWVRWEV